MYNCALCSKTSEAGDPMLRHAVYREDKNGHKQIAREYALCSACKGLVDSGVSIAEVHARMATLIKARENTVAVAPAEGEDKTVVAVLVLPPTPPSGGTFRNAANQAPAPRASLVRKIPERRDIDPARAKHRPNDRTIEKATKPRRGKKPVAGDSANEGV